AQLRRDAEELAAADVQEHRERTRARLSRGVHPDVGVLPLLLRGRLPRALHRRRADAADQAGVATRSDCAAALRSPGIKMRTPNPGFRIRRSPLSWSSYWAVIEGISVGVSVGVSVAVSVGVSVGVAVSVAVAVAVGVVVGVAVGENVGGGVGKKLGIATPTGKFRRLLRVWI